MKTTEQERENCRELMRMYRSYPWNFVLLLLDDIDKLLVENKGLRTLLADVEDARLEEAELQDYFDSKEGNK